MKKLTGLLATAMLLMASQAYAGKTVVLDVQQALLDSKAAAQLRDDMKKEFGDDQNKVIDLEKQAKGLQSKIQKNAGLSSKAEMEKLKMQFQKTFDEYRSQGQALQQRKAQREQAFFGEMRPKLDAILHKLIKDEKIDVIINKKAVIYSTEAVDITPKVVELLNKQ